VAFEQGPDSAIWKNGVGATRSVISLKRTQAKPTLVHPGVERFELKRTAYYTVNLVEYPAIVTIGVQMPIPIAAADRTNVHLHVALLAADAVLKAAMETGVLPT
jgi:hypothetical protein